MILTVISFKKIKLTAKICFPTVSLKTKSLTLPFCRYPVKCKPVATPVLGLLGLKPRSPSK